MHLITQYYNPPNPDRQKEINECFKRNLKNSSISVLHDLAETNAEIEPTITEHPKYRKVENTDGRLTYKRCFDYAREAIPENQVIAIINSDIFLEDSNAWGHISTFFNQPKCKYMLILSRYEYDWDGRVWTEGNFSSYSSDAWILQTPLRDIPDCDFPIGTWFADRAMAERFDRAGYHLYNWAKKYKIYHLDRCPRHKRRHPNVHSTTESDRGEKFICPYLNYSHLFKHHIKPQKAKCTKKCKYAHCGKKIS